MSVINDFEVSRRRKNLMAHWEQYHIQAANINSGNLNKNDLTNSSISSAQLSGRPVTQILSSSSTSTEKHSYESYVNSTKEDRLLQNEVNTVKKTEAYLKHNILMANIV